MDAARGKLSNSWCFQLRGLSRNNNVLDAVLRPMIRWLVPAADAGPPVSHSRAMIESPLVCISLIGSMMARPGLAYLQEAPPPFDQAKRLETSSTVFGMSAQCPLSRALRTSAEQREMAAIDPCETSAAQDLCSAHWSHCPHFAQRPFHVLMA